jgi:hypothetical protein
MLKAELLKMNAEEEIEAFFLDYPNLMDVTSGSGMDYDRSMSRLYVRLKALCRTFNGGQRLTGFIPTQVNKAGRELAEKNEGVYSLRAINQYSEIPNSSDFVFFVYRDTSLKDAGVCLMGGLKARRCRDIPVFRPAFHGDTGLLLSLAHATEAGPAAGGMAVSVPGEAGGFRFNV